VSFRSPLERRKPNLTRSSVVFSYWVDHLNLIEIALANEGIRCCRLDGTMSDRDRGRAIDAFQADADALVFLATIGAGGVGITLTAASCVVIMEPGWNPQAEEQAVDRVHRIGQARPVRVLRLVAAGTLEVGIRRHAAAKLRLASVLLDQKLARKEDRGGVFRQLEEIFRRSASRRAVWRHHAAERKEDK